MSCTIRLSLLVVGGLQDFKDQRLLTIPEDMEAVEFAFSLDGRVAAYVGRRGDECRVVAGDFTSKPARRMIGPVPTPDGKNMAYLAYGGDKHFIHVNDRVPAEGDRTWSLVWGTALSADGAMVAHLLRNQDQGLWAIAVNGKRLKEFKDVPGQPALSGDGKVLAYRVPGGDREYIMLGDTKGPEFEVVTSPALSRDGRIVAYGAEEGPSKLLIRGSDRTALSGWPAAVFISSKGEAAGCVYTRKAGERTWYCVQAGVKKGEEFLSLLGMPSYSPDEKTISYGAKSEGDKYWVVVGERKSEAPGMVGPPAWSPDGKRVGYGAKIGREQWWKVVDVK